MLAEKETANSAKAEGASIDPEEVARFSRIAEEWWDEKGKFKPLHRINPARIGYIKQLVCKQFGRMDHDNQPFTGLSLLDIGCGGGLICEPMCRLGAQVTGVDASSKNVKVAALHARQMGLTIHYRAATAEQLLAEKQQFQVVLALEIIEHVTDPQAFIRHCSQLVKPGGLLIMSTLNRTAKSFIMAIVGAEYVMRWLPRGTHNFRKFVRPSEMRLGLLENGMEVIDTSGLVLNPLKNEWEINPRDIDVNYLMAARKPNIT